MKILITGCLLLLGSTCIAGFQVGYTKLDVKADTLIGRKDVLGKVAGSAYYKRAISYFVIIDGDTSDYSCAFSESKDGGRISIDQKISYIHPTVSYRQRMAELKAILPEAAKEFNFDALSSIGYGRLVASGDLALEVTQQYRKKFGNKTKPGNYTTTALFLKDSKLGTDLDELFKPYSLRVKEVFIEKLFFATKEALYLSGKLETGSTEIPDRILDCSIWVALKKK